MKASKVALSSILILALLLGAAIILQISAPKPVVANVRFEPDTIDLGAPGWTVKEVLVTVWFTGKYDGRDVDPKTVQVEGVLGPKKGWKGTWVERVKVDNAYRWVFRFKLAGGDKGEADLIGLIWQIITHMGIPGPTTSIPLEVTGNLYDGTPFTGTGYIYVLIPPDTPPNPP